MQISKVSRNSAIWDLRDCLDIASCSDLHRHAMELCENPKIRKVKLELPEGPGIPFAGFQVVRAFELELERLGKECQIIGNLAPFGGRTW